MLAHLYVLDIGNINQIKAALRKFMVKASVNDLACLEFSKNSTNYAFLDVNVF